MKTADSALSGLFYPNARGSDQIANSLVSFVYSECISLISAAFAPEGSAKGSRVVGEVSGRAMDTPCILRLWSTPRIGIEARYYPQ
jgi:hypothetical protein